MGDELVSEATELFKKNSMSSYAFPEDAVKSLKAFNDFYQLKSSKTIEKKYSFKVDYSKVKEIFEEAKEKSKNSFPEYEAKDIFSAYGFDISKSYLAKNIKEVKSIAKKINKDLVLKIVSPDILHKSDVFGIKLNVKPKDAVKAYKEIIKNGKYIV